MIRQELSPVTCNKISYLNKDEYIYIYRYIWKQRCERPRFGQSPFATILRESTHPEKKYGCTCHFNIASPTGKPQEQNSLHIKLHNWKPKKTKKQKNKKNKDSRERLGGS